MKHIVAFVLPLLLLPVLCCCTTESRRAEMRQRLGALDVLNRADSVLGSAERDEARELVAFFDAHGTANEQMQACYLLGRCYADMGEAPMALHCYREAAARADTAASDCDFARLSRVYGQSAAIFYQQGLYRDALHYDELSAACGWRGKDTLNALLSYGHKADSYAKLQLTDSAIFIYGDVIRQLKEYHYDQVGAGFSCILAKKLLDSGRMEGLSALFEDYERNSGFFDPQGNISPGREIYYYAKGLYLLNQHRLDSAERLFRKELLSGRDFNNQSAAARGLALLYREKNNADSAARYALYYAEMNDSCYARQSTHEVEQAKAMYDYSRQAEAARQAEKQSQQNERRYWMAVSLALVLLLCLSVLILKYRERQKAQERQTERLRDLQSSYITAQDELDRLRDGRDIDSVVASKELQVRQLEEQIARYEQREYGLKRDEVETAIRNHEAYLNFIVHTNRGTMPSDQEWSELERLMSRHLPSFYHLVSVKRYDLSRNEYRACLALRLRIPSKQVAALLGLSPSSLTIIRKSLSGKLFSIEGSASGFDRRLMRYC